MRRRRLVLGLAGGCGCLAVTLAAVGFLLHAVFGPPRGVLVDLEAPDSVALGDGFEVSVSVVNASSRERRLVDVDIEEGFLAGFEVVGAVPAFREALPLGGAVSYGYDFPLQPGEGVLVRFSMVAVREGEHAGDFAVCVDSIVSCRSRSARIRVRAEP